MASVNDRRIVAVSWAMPPGLFPRSIQVARLLKGLTRHGWDNTVVTLADACRGPFDPVDGGLAETYSPYYELDPVRTTTLKSEPWDLRFRWKHGPLSIIDQHWVLDATAAARRAFWRDGAVLVTFAQPWFDHFVGLAFGRPRLPWVAHFSDPWVDSLYYQDLRNNDRELDTAREAAIMRGCDLVVFTNQYAADLVMHKYPAEVRRKARVVPHAWDPDAQLPDGRGNAAQRRRPLRLSYVGTLLIGRRTADDLLAALALLNTRLGLQGRLELVCVGSGSGTADAVRHVAELGLESIISFRPHVGYRDSVAVMYESDALVVLDAAADSNVFLPSKLVDYLMTGRCVMGITPARGPSADVLDACGFPRLVPGDVDGIAAVLQRLLEQHEAGRALPSAPAAVAQRYRLDRVAADFACILDEAIEGFSWKKRWLSRR